MELRGNENLKTRTNSAIITSTTRMNHQNQKQNRSNSIKSVEPTSTMDTQAYRIERLDSHKARNAFFDRLRTAEETVSLNNRVNNEFGKQLMRLDLNDSFTSDDSFSDDEHIIYNRANTANTTTQNSQFFFNNDSSSNYFIEKHEQLNNNNINQFRNHSDHANIKMQNNWQKNVSMLYSEKSRPFLISAASKLISNKNNNLGSNAKPFDVKNNFSNVLNIDKKYQRKSARMLAAAASANTNPNSTNGSNQESPTSNSEEIEKIEKELKKPIESLNSRLTIQNNETNGTVEIPKTNTQSCPTHQTLSPSSSPPNMHYGQFVGQTQFEKQKTTRNVFTPPLITNIQLSTSSARPKTPTPDLEKYAVSGQLASSTNPAKAPTIPSQTDVHPINSSIYQHLQLLQQPVPDNINATPLLVSNHSNISQEHKSSIVNKTEQVINESMFLNKVTLSAQQCIQLNQSNIASTQSSNNPVAMAQPTSQPSMPTTTNTDKNLTNLTNVQPSTTVQSKPEGEKQPQVLVKPSDNVHNSNIMKANISNLLFRRQNLNEQASQSNFDLKTEPSALNGTVDKNKTQKYLTSFANSQVKQSNELRTEINAYVASSAINKSSKALNGHECVNGIDIQKIDKVQDPVPVDNANVKIELLAVDPASNPSNMRKAKESENKLLWKRKTKKGSVSIFLYISE
jgi:hypothetical protein